MANEIRYEVLIDHDDNPWICRFRRTGQDPKGKRVYWEALDTDSPFVVKRDPDSEPFATTDEAITDFQEARALFSFCTEQSARNVRLILAAEKLRVPTTSPSAGWTRTSE